MAKNIKILIADDSAVFRNLESTLLEYRGYEVLQAKDGAEALKLALTEEPDCILLDIQMPIMDGVQALSAMRKDDRTKDIPIIVVTTIGRKRDREILMAGGADELIGKPIDAGALMKTIRELTAKRAKK